MDPFPLIRLNAIQEPAPKIFLAHKKESANAAPNQLRRHAETRADQRGARLPRRGAATRKAVAARHSSGCGGVDHVPRGADAARLVQLKLPARPPSQAAGEASVACPQVTCEADFRSAITRSNASPMTSTDGPRPVNSSNASAAW